MRWTRRPYIKMQATMFYCCQRSSQSMENDTGIHIQYQLRNFNAEIFNLLLSILGKFKLKSEVAQKNVRAFVRNWNCRAVTVWAHILYGRNMKMNQTQAFWIIFSGAVGCERLYGSMLYRIISDFVEFFSFSRWNDIYVIPIVAVRVAFHLIHHIF